MQIRLMTRAGGRYLCSPEVVRHLEREFSYVKTSEKEGRRHVLAVIQQLLALKRSLVARCAAALGYVVSEGQQCC